ncbi:MAG TPA: Hsp20/alpha crystallin family protein [Alphaproteobacteria bacterium]|nr:Hsp20/alpha crystallin family protein [Alphaproteobacteria bacterium]
MRENGTKEIDTYNSRRNPGYMQRIGLFDSPLLKDFFDDPFFNRSLGLFNSPMFDLYDKTPKIDIYRKDNNLVMKADFPGVKKEDIQINVDDKNKTLELIVDSKSETKDEKKEYYRRERREIHYHNTYDISNVDLKKITSKYDNGVLEVTLPLIEGKEQSNKRVIEIN